MKKGKPEMGSPMADSKFASSLNLPGCCSADKGALMLGMLPALRERPIVSTSGGVAKSTAPGALRTLLDKFPHAAGPVYWSQTVLDLVLKSDAGLRGSGNEDPIPDNYTAKDRAGDWRLTICVTVRKSSRVSFT